MIQRVRFSANDPLIPLLRAAGHRIDPDVKIDKSLDYSTVVVAGRAAAFGAGR